jgi:hypothetical protein
MEPPGDCDMLHEMSHAISESSPDLLLALRARVNLGGRTHPLIDIAVVLSTVRRPNRQTTCAMVLVSTAITYPHPRHTRTSARRQSGQLGSPGPNFLPYSSQT